MLENEAVTEEVLTKLEPKKARRFERVNATKVFWVTFGVVAVPILLIWLVAFGSTLRPWIFPQTETEIAYNTLPPGFVVQSPELRRRFERIEYERKIATLTAVVFILLFPAGAAFAMTALVLGLLYRREVYSAVLTWFRT